MTGHKPSNAPLSYSRQALAPTAASRAGFSKKRVCLTFSAGANNEFVKDH